jgi:hypothetical protein
VAAYLLVDASTLEGVLIDPVLEMVCAPCVEAARVERVERTQRTTHRGHTVR